MEKTNYQKQIQNTINMLDDVEQMMQLQIINLGMEGEMKTVSDNFEVGEVMTLKISDFKQVDDANVLALINLFDKVADENDRLKNLFPPTNDDNEYPF